MRKTLIVLAVVALAGCMSVASYGDLDERYTTIEVKNNEPWDHIHFTVWYESAQFIKEQEDKKADIEMREPNYAGIPDGGFILVRMSSITIGSADPKFLRVIAKDSAGVEVGRYEGRPDVPAADASGRWYSISVFPVMTKVSYPMSIRAINMLDSESYSEWSIVENGM